jgi:putative phosphoesterase
MKLLVLSDIHGNWQALSAVLAAEQPFDTAAFCGDVVDYGPEPVRCVHWLMQHSNHAVRGNHDHALAFDADCRCSEAFRKFARLTRAWHTTLLTRQERDFLGHLPTVRSFEWQGLRFRVAHATPQGDMFDYLPAERWQECTEALDDHFDFVLVGHTHIQGMRSIGSTVVVNPGSVGQAKDEPGQAAYAVIKDGKAMLKRTLYDVEATIASLKKAPLPNDVIEGLVQVLQPA